MMMASWRILRNVASSVGSVSKKHMATAVSCTAVKPPRECFLDIPETRVTTLKNGFNIASENTAIPSCTVGVWIQAGSRYEHPQNNGVGNLLEHVLFKGTKKRSAAELEEEIARLGAEVGIYTGREHSAVYARCQSKHAAQVVELLADVVLNCSVSEAAVEKEKGVILNQIKEEESNHRETVMNLMHKAAFQNTPLQHSVIGSVDVLMNLGVKDLVEYMEDHFKAARMCLVGAGGVDHHLLEELGDKYFGNVSNIYPRNIPDFEHPCRFTGSELHYDDYTLPNTYAAVAVEGVPFNHPDRIPLSVATAMQGKWRRTECFGPHSPHMLAQKVGWWGNHETPCDEYEAFNISYKNDGLFGVYHNSQEDAAYSTIMNILNGWKHMCMRVSDDEVLMGKNLLKTQLGKNMQTTLAVADDIGRQIVDYGTRVPLFHLYDQINSLTTEHFREVCSNHLWDRDPVSVGVGRMNADTYPDYIRCRSAMSWWRL